MYLQNPSLLPIPIVPSKFLLPCTHHGNFKRKHSWLDMRFTRSSMGHTPPHYLSSLSTSCLWMWSFGCGYAKIRSLELLLDLSLHLSFFLSLRCRCLKNLYFRMSKSRTLAEFHFQPHYSPSLRTTSCLQIWSFRCQDKIIGALVGSLAPSLVPLISQVQMSKDVYFWMSKSRTSAEL